MSRSEVFVDATFLVAVADAEADEHAAARAAFVDLVERSRRGAAQMVSHAMAVGAASERLVAAGVGGRSGLAISDLVAPIDIEPTHPDALRLARATAANDPSLDVVQALTLATLDRRRIRTIATFDPLYAAYDLEIVPPADAG